MLSYYLLLLQDLVIHRVVKVTEGILHKSFVFIVKSEICLQAMHAELVSQNYVCKLFLYI